MDSELTELSPLQPLMTPNGWYCSQQYYGGEKKVLWLLLSKEKVTWHKYSGTENCQKGELCKLAIILLSPLWVQIPSWYGQIAGVESTEKTFYRHPTAVHGCIREVFFFPSKMSEFTGILENILSTAFSSSDLWGKQGPEGLGWHLASVTQSEESSGFQTSNATLCKDVMASLCTAHFPHHPNLRGTVVLGRYPLQLTDLTLLRLCNDDLPRLDCSCRTGGLLALLLSLDLDSSGLLSQREVVLDRLRRSHRLAHLLLWNGRRFR